MSDIDDTPKPGESLFELIRNDLIEEMPREKQHDEEIEEGERKKKKNEEAKIKRVQKFKDQVQAELQKKMDEAYDNQVAALKVQYQDSFEKQTTAFKAEVELRVNKKQAEWDEWEKIKNTEISQLNTQIQNGNNELAILRENDKVQTNRIAILEKETANLKDVPRSSDEMEIENPHVIIEELKKEIAAKIFSIAGHETFIRKLHNESVAQNELIKQLQEEISKKATKDGNPATETRYSILSQAGGISATPVTSHLHSVTQKKKQVGVRCIVRKCQRSALQNGGNVCSAHQRTAKNLDDKAEIEEITIIEKQTEVALESLHRKRKLANDLYDAKEEYFSVLNQPTQPMP